MCMPKKRSMVYAKYFEEGFMTLPDERYRAITMAKWLLTDLCDPQKTPRIPKVIRDRALAALRHYPSKWDMDRAAQACPEVFVERYEDLTKFIKHGIAARGDEDRVE